MFRPQIFSSSQIAQTIHVQGLISLKTMAHISIFRITTDFLLTLNGGATGFIEKDIVFQRQ